MFQISLLSPHMFFKICSSLWMIAFLNNNWSCWVILLVDWLTFNIFNMQYKTRVQDILVGLGLGRSQSDLFGDCSCTSIIIHHLLKELPSGIICSSAMDILHLIECNDDFSFNQVPLTIVPHSSCIILLIWLHFHIFLYCAHSSCFDIKKKKMQSLNYKLLGLRLCESISQVNEAIAVVNNVIQVFIFISSGLFCSQNLESNQKEKLFASCPIVRAFDLNRIYCYNWIFVTDT